MPSEGYREARSVEADDEPGERSSEVTFADIHKCCCDFELAPKY